jgi:hypothetical protein
MEVSDVQGDVLVKRTSATVEVGIEHTWSVLVAHVESVVAVPSVPRLSKGLGRGRGHED